MQRVLTEAERILFTERLKQAEDARHKLLTGKSVEMYVDQNGEQVRYTKATLDGLVSYIDELNCLLNPAFARANVRRPLRFVF